jgi:hypothetical protein
MEKITKEQAIKLNQKMMSEWMEECEQDKLFGYCMLVFDENTNMRVFKSEAMSIEQVIFHLEFAIAGLKRNL